MKLSVIIPTYNEERTITRLIRRILATRLPIEYEMILVDDHSADRTFAIEQRWRQAVQTVPITVLRNRVNKGKGACIRQGVKHASGDLIIVQDGDLEYKPREIPKLLRPILEGRAQVVFGSRFLHRRSPAGMAWQNCLANRFLTWLTDLLYHLHLTDMETCYKIMPREVLNSLAVRADRFEFEPEVTAKLATRGIPILEVPISYHGRTRRAGKKIVAKDFFIAAWTLLRYRFSS